MAVLLLSLSADPRLFGLLRVYCICISRKNSVYSDQRSNLLQASVMCVYCDQEHPVMFTYGISVQVKQATLSFGF